MATKKPAAGHSTTIANSTFYGGAPTNEHDVAALAAMSEAVTQLAIAVQKIADSSKGRAMTTPMISITGQE